MWLKISLVPGVHNKHGAKLTKYLVPFLDSSPSLVDWNSCKNFSDALHMVWGMCMVIQTLSIAQPKTSLIGIHKQLHWRSGRVQAVKQWEAGYLLWTLKCHNGRNGWSERLGWHSLLRGYCLERYLNIFACILLRLRRISCDLWVKNMANVFRLLWRRLDVSWIKTKTDAEKNINMLDHQWTMLHLQN